MKRETPMHITITSHLAAEGAPETVTTEARGVLRQVGDHHTLAYTERRESDERVMTTLSWQRGVRRLHLTCRGAVRWEADFDPALPAETRYEVPPYAFTLCVQCRELRLGVDENGGELRLVYRRELGGDAAEVTLSLAARVREEETP